LLALWASPGPVACSAAFGRTAGRCTKDWIFVASSGTLSNYGNYIILRHHLEGLEIYSLYAHLREIRSDLKAGHEVRGGEILGTMGRTSNTRQEITRDRAHLHFELNLLVNDRFTSWYRKNAPGQRNDHGVWNGQNLLALDPYQIFLAQKEQGPAFSLIRYVRTQPELCRVLVRATRFPWLTRYPGLVKRNPTAEQEGACSYEIALNFNGVPFELIPRAASEIKPQGRLRLLSVNEAEQQNNPCRKLLTKRGQKWQLTNQGTRLLELLIYSGN
jgi:hypothetical protein